MITKKIVQGITQEFLLNFALDINDLSNNFSTLNFMLKTKINPSYKNKYNVHFTQNLKKNS